MKMLGQVAMAEARQTIIKHERPAIPTLEARQTILKQELQAELKDVVEGHGASGGDTEGAEPASEVGCIFSCKFIGTLQLVDHHTFIVLIVKWPQMKMQFFNHCVMPTGSSSSERLGKLYMHARFPQLSCD